MTSLFCDSSTARLNPTYPVIGKLHGDYRYDWLRNTKDELQQLEIKLKEYERLPKYIKNTPVNYQETKIIDLEKNTIILH